MRNEQAAGYAAAAAGVCVFVSVCARLCVVWHSECRIIHVHMLQIVMSSLSGLATHLLYKPLAHTRMCVCVCVRCV
jgi:hypothetical protein